jgi:hypothetical protein
VGGEWSTNGRDECANPMNVLQSKALGVQYGSKISPLPLMQMDLDRVGTWL